MTPVSVRGNATSEELAAVLAVVSRRGEAPPSAYETWRRTRLAALARNRSGASPHR